MNNKSYMGNITRNIIIIIMQLIMIARTSNVSDSKTEIYTMGENITLNICNLDNEVLSKEQFSCYFQYKDHVLKSIGNDPHVRFYKITKIQTGCACIGINNLKMSDMGQYSCGFDNILTGKRLIVQGEPTVKINGMNLTTVKAFDPTIITCERNGSKDTQLIIKLGSKDLGGTLHFQSPYLVIKRVIYNFDLNDRHEKLICSASIRNKSKFDRVLKINVKDSPCNETRKFTFNYNDEVTLMCPNNYYRSKNHIVKRLINSSIIFTIDKIYHVPRNKSDVYTCIGEDESGTSYCHYDISFERFLSCYNKVNEYQVKLGSNITLNCLLRSSSNIISYEWSLDGKPMGTEQTYRVTRNQNNSIFTCTTKNQDGKSAFCKHKITILYHSSLTIFTVSAGASAGGIFIFILIMLCILIQRHKYKFNLKSPRRLYDSVTYYFAYRNEIYGRPGNDKNDEGVSKTPRLEVTNLCLIGAGNFGPVYKGYSKTLRGRSFRKPKTVAVKLPQVRMLESEVSKRYLCQIHTHYQLAVHKNIIACYGRTHYNGIIGSVLEYAQFGPLKTHLETLFNKYFLEPASDKKNVSELNFVCFQFCREIAAGMAHLHRHNIVHMSLSAKNVLLADNLICKVGDFGLTYIMPSSDQATTYYDPIPIRWMSPEFVTYNLYTKESDIWTYGIVMWEILTLGFTPYFEFKTGSSVKEAIQVQYRMALPQHSSSWLNELIQNCWNESSINRPSFDQIDSAFKNLPPSFQCFDFTKYDSNMYENANLKIYREIVI